MIIDRLFEGYAGFGGRVAEVMAGLNGSSVYGCTSPGTEPGQTSPWRPTSGEREGGWCSTGSPSYPQPEPAFTCIPAEPSLDGLHHSHLRYQGVRVKKTVKELIEERQIGKVQTHHQKTEMEFPAICRMLEGGKRPAEMTPPHHVTKRPATDYDNVLNAYNPMVTPLKEQSICEEFVDLFGTSGLSIESVKVRDVAMPTCHLPQVSQEPVLNLYTTPSSPFNVSYPLSQHTECPYSSPPQSLSPQEGLRPSVTPSPTVSFFQWQIQQEEEKLAGLSPQDLTSRDGDGDTFLHIAVAQGRRALAFVLARKMSKVCMLDMKEHNSQSAFQVSVAANQHLIAQDLLSLGAQINTTDCWGRTPLHVCAEKGHTLILQAIKKCGQNVNLEAVDYEGLTPLHIAVLAHNAVVQDLSRLATPQAPQAASLMRRRKLLGECINTLLHMGASYGTMDRKSGRTSLHMAAEEANVELLRLFLDQLGSLSVINMKAYNGNTALHMATAQTGRQGQVHAIQLLMRRGADPSAKNLENEQPIQLVPEGPVGDQVRRILKGRSPQTRPYPQL